MKTTFVRTSIIAAFTILTVSAASAQTTTTLPDSSQTTTVTADVSEQAKVTVPTGVSFSVTNVGASTVAAAASVTIDGIVLATATKQLKVSLQANAAAFTPSVTGAVTWSAADVSWGAGTFSNLGVGAAGTLSSTAYGEVATCAADVASCSTTNLVFTLAPKASVKRSGGHTLSMTWKIESIGS